MKIENGKEAFPPFSVAMSVYAKDNEEWFDAALRSIVYQTVQTAEIVLVVDGVVGSPIQSVIKKYMDICKEEGIVFRVVCLPVNQGLAYAMRIAIQVCSYELIARMDSDDIAVKNRFEQQLQIFLRYPAVEIVGGDIQEFITDMENTTGRRVVPQKDENIKKYMKRRCPFNHVTVMYKKSAVLRVGGYVDLFWNEDYYLWVRMAESGCVMKNSGTTLVYVRVGKDMYQRRGGLRYFKSECYIQKYMLKKHIITIPIFCINLCKRCIVQLLLPTSVRGWVFRMFARKK